MKYQRLTQTLSIINKETYARVQDYGIEIYVETRWQANLTVGTTKQDELEDI